MVEIVTRLHLKCYLSEMVFMYQFVKIPYSVIYEQVMTV